MSKILIQSKWLKNTSNRHDSIKKGNRTQIHKTNDRIVTLRDDVCIMSDRHDSIAKEASTVYPGVSHCACIFQLWNNIKVKFKKSQNQLSQIFFKIGIVCVVEEFNSQMTEIEAIDKKVQEYLLNIELYQFM